MKTFFKTFIITLVVFTCIFIPTFAWWEGIQDNTIFSSDVNLSQDLPMMVDENSEFFDAFTSSKRLNVLLLGVNGNLADTIMLLSYDLDNNQIALISIPRDTYFERDGYNGPSEKKINASYASGGPLETAKSVSKLLEGIPINCYMKVDYDGVENIVDSMGGVPMNVPFHMKYTDVWDDPPLYIDIPAGEQVLDGKTAVKFIRFRKGDKGYEGYSEGDIGRIATQQEFMKSAFKQALGFNILRVVNSVMKNVESDINIETATAVAKKATSLSTENLKTYTVPGAADYGEGNLSFFYSSETKIKEMLKEIYSSVPADTSESETE